MAPPTEMRLAKDIIAFVHEAIFFKKSLPMHPFFTLFFVYNKIQLKLEHNNIKKKEW